MRHFATAFAAIAALGSTAHAGGVDRSTQPIGIIFEEGNYARLSFRTVSPSVSGVALPGAPTAGGRSGDMTEDYTQFAFAYKNDLTENLDFALILDQPFGAHVDYLATQPYFAAGASARLDSTALTGILRYSFPSDVSVYGGIRYQTLKARAIVPFVSNYSAVGERDDGIGWLAGIAYERPDIALRVSLTYNSKVTHDLSTTENSAGLGGPNVSNTRIETPQSLNLDFRTGIAKDTLLFGGIRWAEWSAFEISPSNYVALTGGTPLVSFADDRVTYTLGIGRRFTDKWSGLASVSYEPSTGSLTGNLGPTDGFTSFTVGARYDMDPIDITFGVSYVLIGDANTTLGGGVAATDFSGNDAIGAGIQIGYRF